MEYTHIDHPFPPVFDGSSRILILGTLPSVASRQNAFYYGHPQNRFWMLMAALLGASVPQSIAEKRSLLLSHGVALWDVIQSCDILGSSDSSIRNAVPTDLRQILDCADIRRVYANGNKAAALYRKYQQPQTGLSITTLPSTSPANAAWTMEKLIACWGGAILPALTEPTDPTRVSF